MIIRTLIIEDEEPARMLLKNYIQQFSELDLIGEYADGFSGGKAINELKPDLIFIDIQMPRLSGFEVIELIDHKPMIIFTTAFDQFAIKAFEANAMDYLLKPFSRERFAQAVSKIISKKKGEIVNRENIQGVLQTIDEKTELLSRVAVRNGNKIHVISLDSIQYFEADDDYVRIHTKDQSFLKEKTMKYFETHLDNKQFVRIHRSYIVNVNEINRIEYYDKEQYIAILKSGQSLKVSVSGYRLLKEILGL